METDVDEINIKEETKFEVYSEEDLSQIHGTSIGCSTSQQIQTPEATLERTEETDPLKLDDVKSEKKKTKEEFGGNKLDDDCMSFETVIVREQVKIEYEDKYFENVTEEPEPSFNEGKHEMEDIFEECGIISSTSHMIPNGPKEQLSGVVFPCSSCGVMSSNLVCRIHHENACKENNRCYSDQKNKRENCNKTFNSKDHLNEHIILYTGRESFSCELCLKKFTRKTGLKNHLKSVHQEQKSHQCDLCDKTFTLLSNLKKHKRTHEKEKPYSCGTCSKKFISLYNLSVHIMRVHTGNKPYSCDICEKKFSASSTLIQHMRIHTGDKPYSCNTCSKKFISSSDLNKHTRVHTGEKPFSCIECKRKFPQSNHLKGHMRSHTGEKPYSCKICDKKFTRSFNLQAHMRSHARKKHKSHL